MRKKINNTEKTLTILKVLSLSVTLMAILYLSSVFYTKYFELKSSYFEKVSDELHDKYVPDFDIHYIDYEEEDYYYSTAKSEHFDDNVEKLIDYEFSNGKYYGYTESLKEQYKSNDKIIDSIVKETRKQIRNEIIEKRIQYSAKIAIEKEQHRLDALRNIQLQKLEKAINRKVSNENIISHFSAAFIVGAFIGSSIIPLLFWLIWLLFKMRLRKLFDLDKHRKIELIKSHPKYAHDYNEKYESLLDLEKSKILNQLQFIEKHNNLIQRYYLPIIEEQRIDEKKELEIKLKAALQQGNITQDEFDKRNMVNTVPYKYKLRPGYKSKEVLIEIFGGIEHEDFVNDFKLSIIEIEPELLKKEDDWVNDEILYHFNSKIGKYTMSSSITDVLFIMAEDNQNCIIAIEQLLMKSQKFEKIEVDFDEYA